MKRLTAILLAMLMVCFCFATTVMADETTEDATADITADVTSEDATSEDATSEDAPVAPAATNIAAGKTYTITSDAADGKATYNGICTDGTDIDEFWGLLTNGTTRAVELLNASGAGKDDQTVELAGTNRTHFVTISFGASYDLSSVVLGTARRGNNRYANIAKIEALVNGAWVNVAFTETATVIEGAEQYGGGTTGIEPHDQFFNIEAAIDVKGATAVRVALDTKDNTGLTSYNGPRGYIVQLDEIEVYGVTAGSGNGGNGGSTPNTPTTPSTPSAGDLGLGVFAVLAVVSLAGVVVAKKVK